MRLTNDSYLITLNAGGTEYYYKDGERWIKRSTRGRKFEATAEQVLNHLLPHSPELNPMSPHACSIAISTRTQRRFSMNFGLRIPTSC